MRIATLFVRHGSTKYPDAEKRVEAIFAKQLADVERTILVIDNALPRDTVEQHPNHTLLGGDNTFWEFSAWDRAIDYLGPQIWSFDLIHLVTSAFDTLYVRYLDMFDARLLSIAAEKRACIGHIDCYGEPIEFSAFRSQHWLRTSFLFLAPTELKALGSLVSYRDMATLFSGDPACPFRADAGISQNYQDYIIGWLTGADIGQGTAWHTTIHLNASNLPLFESKALAIINEHMLSARLRALGCRVLDATWLATAAAALGVEPRLDTRWREQLGNRGHDSVKVPLPVEVPRARRDKGQTRQAPAARSRLFT